MQHHLLLRVEGSRNTGVVAASTPDQMFDWMKPQGWPAAPLRRPVQVPLKLMASTRSAPRPPAPARVRVHPLVVSRIIRRVGRPDWLRREREGGLPPAAPQLLPRLRHRISAAFQLT